MQMETSFKYIDENYKRIAYEIGEAKAKYPPMRSHSWL